MNAEQKASATFKPRPMKTQESWALDGDIVAGEGKSIDLNEVTHAYFSDTKQNNQQYSLSLKLFAPDQKVKIACVSNGSYGGRASCRRLHAAIMQRLHEVNPEARVHIEGGPLKQLLWFGIMLILGLGALWLLVAGLTAGQTILVVIGLIATLLFGWGVYHFSPWPAGKFERSPIEAAKHIADGSP